MEISRQEVSTYAAMLARIQRNAGRKGVAAVKRWMKQHPEWTPSELRDATIAILQPIVGDYGMAASSLACDLYDGIMMARGFENATPWTGDFDAQVDKAVRYQLDHALKGETDAWHKAVDDLTQYYVRNHANETTMQNCERDHRKWAAGGLGSVRGNRLHGPLHMAVDEYGAGPRRSNADRRRGGGRSLELGDPAFARVPTGAVTCSYCLMLASRGFAYHSAKTAGAADHRGCNCAIVPGIYGDTVEGVDEKALYDCWREMEAAEANAKKYPERWTPEKLQAEKDAIAAKYGDSLHVTRDPGEIRKMARSNPASAIYEPRKKMADNYVPTDEAEGQYG